MSRKKHRPSNRQLRLLADLDEPVVVSARGQLVDKLGQIRAAIADLRAQESRVKNELSRLLGGDGSCEGGTFKFTVSTFRQVKLSAR